MSSDFNISEFRRRRASDNPPPPETGQLPLVMPNVDPSGPQEFVPQAVSVPISAPIPEAVADPYTSNPYASDTYAPMAEYAQPAINPVAVQPPALSQAAVPLPMPASMLLNEKAKTESKGLFAGFLAKFKKDPALKGKAAAPLAPVEFQAGQPLKPAQPIAPQAAPLRAAIPVKAPTLNSEPISKLKSGLPTWAAFLLGLMTGVILTFTGLAFTAKTLDNSLEARFSEAAKVVQSAETATEEDAAETTERPAPLH